MSDPHPDIDFASLHRRLDEVEQALRRGSRLDEAQQQALLESRAAALSPARAAPEPDGAEVLAFSVGGERYALPVEHVDEVLDLREVCGLPGAPRSVLGAMVARSRVVTVLDLRQLLGLEGGGMSDLTQVVVVSVDDQVFGLAVERIDGREQAPRAPLPLVPGPFLWVTPDRTAVLDATRLADPDAAEGGHG